MLLTVACEKDVDGKSASVIYDLVTVYSDSQKTVTRITTDDGRCWNLLRPVTADVSDSTFRCLCGYADADGLMRLYYLEQIYSTNPFKPDKYPSRPTDPLDIVSLWNSGGYINMHLGIKTTNFAPHGFSFCEDSIVNGKVFFTLIHRQPQTDNESYTKDVYLSLPLKNYADCDSAAIRINTYDGIRDQTFRLR
ncbi:MAG: hypothetical protein MJY59_04670 [Bacteroidaceae bacterium]|nr:hypothetical protein [Bacteroidaceae bacterium]